MGERPPKSCAECGCPGLAYKGPYCEKHEEKRGYVKGKRLSPSKRGYDGRWRRLRLKKLGINPWCEICGEQAATIVHHLDPVSSGNAVSCHVSRLQSVCARCHSKMEGWGAGMSAALTRKDRRMMGKRWVICGAPCSGKSTWAEQHAAPGDIVWDLDKVALALTSMTTHTKPPETIPLLMAMREALVAWLLDNDTIADVYLVATQRADAARIAARIGAEVVTMEADQATCLERLAADGSRQQVAARQQQAIQNWFADDRGSVPS